MATHPLTIDDMLTKEEQAVVESALELQAYVEDSIVPKLQDEAERQKFLEDPADYLRRAGAPNSDTWTPESVAAFNDLFAESDALNLDCLFCKLGFGTLILGVVAAGLVVTAAIIAVLASALAPKTGGISVALGLIALAGIKAGLKLTGQHIDRLSEVICRHLGTCA